ncbi:30428_t:CDS:2, partial [Racocetra persica]
NVEFSKETDNIKIDNNADELDQIEEIDEVDEEIEEIDNNYEGEIKETKNQKTKMMANKKDLVNNEILEEKSTEFEGFDKEYRPYFPNFTSFALYVWITKYIISTSTYEDLATIITHSKFCKDDVIENIKHMRVNISKKYEFWHGSLWQESPLFGLHEIRSNSR